MTTHLLGLRAENFKRLSLVDVEFDPAGGVVAVMGENEAGKSSLLDALEVAIAGRKAPKMTAPVKHGADTARIVARFDDIEVTRTYKVDGGTAIEIRAADGRRVAGAEDLLRSLYSHVALDPLAFSRLSDADQVATLLPMIGFDPEPYQREHDEVFELRTDVNRDARALAARLAAFPAPNPKLPTEPISVAELTDELSRGLSVNVKRREYEQQIESRESSIAANAERIAELEQTIAGLRDRNEQLGADIIEARTQLATVAAVDVEPIREKIASAEQTNERIRQERERAAVAAQHAEAEKHSDELTARISEIKERRQAALAAAKMPVPGLSIDDETGVLTLDDIPFSQASTGVKIRTGTAIAMTLNPELRVIVIRDASLLDAGNRDVIDSLARANGFLVLMEIADESMPVGVVIEAGEVREVRP